MKINLINRNFYEVYFIKRNGKRPMKRDIYDFLQANHPCFDSACPIDRKPRTICGKKYDMITVLDDKKRIDAKYWTTNASLVSASSLAQHKCAISCPGETIYLGDNPRAVPAEPEKNEHELYDYQFDTDKALIDFAQQEKIHARLFFPVRSASLIFFPVLLLGALALLLFTSTTMKTHINTNRTDSSQAVPESPIFEPQPETEEAPSFWKIFYPELQAAHDAGSKITDYLYDRQNIPSTTVILEGGSPEAIQNNCRPLSINDQVPIPSIKYVNGKATFTASFEIWKDTPPIPDLRQTLAEVSAFDDFCDRNDFSLSSIQSLPEPKYSLSLPNGQLPVFLVNLEKYSRSNQLDIFNLHILNAARSGSFQILLQFCPLTKPDSGESSISRTDTIIAAFGISKKPETPIAQHSFDDTLIGKIESPGTNAIVFLKTTEGKTRVQGDPSE